MVNCEKLKVDVSKCKQYIKLQMENARLEGAKYIEAKQGGFQQAPAQGGFNQQPPQKQGGFNLQHPPQQSAQWPHGNQGQQPAPNFPPDNTPPF